MVIRRGRAPCCDKSKVKKGPWSPAEDSRLISFIHKHGHGNWRALPKLAGLSRCGKSCRLRWINYLRPDVKRGNFSPEEEEAIINLHHSMGNKWSKIASHFPGRTDNEIKNVWNTHLKKKKKKLMNNTKNIDATNKDSLTTYNSASPSSTSCISYGDLNLDKEAHEEEGQESNNTTHHDSINDAALDHDHVNKKNSMSQVEEMISSFNNCNASAPSSSIMSTTDEETSQEMAVAAADHEIIEIPFEYCDIDFWNMFDDIPKDSNIVSQQHQQQEHEQEQEQEQEQSHEEEEEGEYKKWLSYLENELGLVDSDRPVH